MTCHVSQICSRSRSCVSAPENQPVDPKSEITDAIWPGQFTFTDANTINWGGAPWTRVSDDAAPFRACSDTRGTWDIDHAPLIDVNTTRRDAWLAWARARNVSEVYIAPHAGADALISIPGVEGSPANDKRFCDFVWLAERQGLSVQLLSDPATDMKFIRNCSARATVQ